MNHTSFLGVGGAVLGVLMGSLIIKLEKIGVAVMGVSATTLLLLPSAGIALLPCCHPPVPQLYISECMQHHVTHTFLMSDCRWHHCCNVHQWLCSDLSLQGILRHTAVMGTICIRQHPGSYRHGYRFQARAITHHCCHFIHWSICCWFRRDPSRLEVYSF